MGPVTAKCRDCQGSGLEAAVSDWGFDDCAGCSGTGRVRLCSEEEFERLRQEVLVRAEAAEAAGRQDGRTPGGAL